MCIVIYACVATTSMCVECVCDLVCVCVGVCAVKILRAWQLCGIHMMCVCMICCLRTDFNSAYPVASGVGAVPRGAAGAAAARDAATPRRDGRESAAHGRLSHLPPRQGACVYVCVCVCVSVCVCECVCVGGWVGGWVGGHAVNTVPSQTKPMFCRHKPLRPRLSKRDDVIVLIT